MRKVIVNIPPNSYEVRIGPRILNQAGTGLKGLGFKGKAVVITNPAVRALYGEALKSSLEEAGFSPAIFEVPDGEEYKSLESAGRLYSQLSDFQAERTTPLLALGGGVIGDLAGFVAATYMRGIPLIHLPTTLLAQVDSSIGGKVAVNHGALKNTIGAFYQPKLVIADVSALKTLPEKEVGNGLAEIIKYGIIQDAGLFRLIENNLSGLKSRDEELMVEVVSRCAGIKAGIVEKDEKDLGLRNLLNYGHTVGHAIETASGFHQEHGEAVAVGMLAAAVISRRMGILPEPDLARIKELIINAGLPAGIASLEIDKLLPAMKHDKKKLEGSVRFVLPETIGSAFISREVDPSLVERVLEDLNEKAQGLPDHPGK